jgi:hypothetical protein
MKFEKRLETGMGDRIGYLLLVLAQLRLLARNQGGNIGLELLAAVLDGEGQPVNAGRRQAQGRCVGEGGRVRVEVRHGLLWWCHVNIGIDIDHGGSEPIWLADDTGRRGRLRAACQYPCWREGVTWGVYNTTYLGRECDAFGMPNPRGWMAGWLDGWTAGRLVGWAG